MKRTLEALGMLRVGVCAPELKVADVRGNTARIVEARRRAAADGVQLLVFPELGITGYSCGDLFFQPALLRAAEDAVWALEEETEQEDGPALVVGLPLRVEGRTYNCAALVGGGRTWGIVPKTYLPTRKEFYEARWFVSGAHAGATTARITGSEVPFGTDLLFELDVPGMARRPRVGVEVCEDLWAPNPPSGRQAIHGADVLVNLSASNELLGKAGYRRTLVTQQSARCLSAYLYASAGPGESTTDLVYSGHCMVAENGRLLAETDRFAFDTRTATADVDLDHLEVQRALNSSFATAEQVEGSRPFRLVDVEDALPAGPTVEAGGDLRRTVAGRPFVPADAGSRAASCEEIFAIQATGLARRLRHTGARSVTIGISGGLDSTLALLVTARAFDLLGLDRKGIEALTMPGFGTTDRTRGNAERLVEALGANLRVVGIDAAVRQHFADIGHDESVHDVVYENAQARERTQILMDVANATGGFVVGTGDLSEFALGWCTYNADHMSMYHVNAGVPKTLVRYIVEWVADTVTDAEDGIARLADPACAALLRDICATPITPELLPLEEGELQQETEATVGPYDLHDFFLYHVVRHHEPPAKVLFLALHAWHGTYDEATVQKWLSTFYRRFFSQQFKRSAMPDGPMVGSVALSPRGDWRMPSDATVDLWLAQLDRGADD